MRLLLLGVTKLSRNVTVSVEPRPIKNRFSVNIALISIFSALWVVLNLTVAPISFRLTGLPVIHSVVIFFILFLVIWATSQYGAVSLVGIIGSAIVLLSGGPLPVIGFILAAIIFDLVFLVNHHRFNFKPANVGVAVFATVAAAFSASILNFVLVSPAFALIVWAGLVIIGGIIGMFISLPIIGILEKAQVKRVKTD
ncbi:MAG TPA: hypothetical protein VLU95_01605 [Candidatus Acidoferrum sp.]|nr:hypothetical protein [Candidatus Acidoferrum sp.]